MLSVIYADCNYTQLSVKNETFMPTVVMPSVIMLNVVAPCAKLAEFQFISIHINFIIVFEF